MVGSNDVARAKKFFDVLMNKHVKESFSSRHTLSFLFISYFFMLITINFSLVNPCTQTEK